MMKALTLGVGAIAATLGGHFAAALVSGGDKPVSKAEERVALDIIKLEPVSVPIIRGGIVEGYVIARIVVAALAADVKNGKPVLAAYAGEAVFRSIFEERSLNFKKLEPGEVASLAEKITRFANERIGRQTVRNAIVESLNFVSSGEVRAPQGGR